MTKREFNGIDTKPMRMGLVFPFLFFVFISMLASSCGAQWKQLFTDPASFRVIYFLDLPGPPRIGFLGTFESLLKTTDGGCSWDSIIFNLPEADISAGLDFTDITFKDSMTGWISSYIGCLKTTDGGDTWSLSDSAFGTTGIYYDSISGGLFLSTFAGAAPAWGEQDAVSWDYGVTWQPFAFVGNEFSGGFAFSDGENALMSYGDIYYDESWWRTKDGGHTWNSISFDTGCWQPLAIAGTNTYFVNTWWGNILRTDDAGNTWKLVHTFLNERLEEGVFGNANQATSSSCIRGTLDSLYVMVPSGCYLSTDQGVTWRTLCGVPDLYFPAQRFYVKDKSLYVVGSDSNTISTLWYLNLDSLNLLGTTFAFSDSTTQKNVTPGQKVTVNFSPKTADPIGIDSGHIVIHFDSTSLVLDSLTLPDSWVIRDSTSGPGYLDLFITADSSQPLPNPILTLIFSTYLSSSTSAKVWLDSANLSGHRLNCDCAVASASGPDSVQINFTGCGDSLILAAMNDSLPFVIESIQPNPAQNEITVNLAGTYAASVIYELYDELGSLHSSGVISSNEATLNVSNVPSGIYYLRFSSNSHVQTRSISIER